MMIMMIMIIINIVMMIMIIMMMMIIINIMMMMRWRRRIMRMGILSEIKIIYVFLVLLGQTKARESNDDET